MKKLAGFGLLLMLITSTVVAGNNKISVENGWVRAVPPVSKNTAAYFTLTNSMKQDDVLLYLCSDVAEHTEFHTIIEEPNGAKRMQKMPHATIKAGQDLELKPGGYHVMLIGLKQPLKKTDQVTIELLFQRAGKIKVTLPVKMAEPGDGDHHHHHH